MCEVITIIGFSTLVRVVIPKLGKKICPSPSNILLNNKQIRYYIYIHYNV